MDPLIIISTDNAGTYFSLFYLLSFLISISIIFFTAIQKKYPVNQTLILISSGVYFFILGTTAFGLSVTELKELFLNPELQNINRRTVIGGLVGLLFGLWIAKKIIRFKRPVFDLLAVALPLTMAVQKVGCLMVGCCYGHTTDLPWGVAYSKPSIVYNSHLVQGLLLNNEQVSLYVHPTPLYQIIFCILIGFAVWKSAKFWKSSGSQFLFSLLLYSIFRFFIEFWRAPLDNGWLWHNQSGLNNGQWITLLIVVVLAITILVKERYFRAIPLQVELGVDQFSLNVALLFFLIVMTAVWKNFFSLVEYTTILVIIIPTLLVILWTFYKKLFPTYKFILPTILVLCLLLMSQTYLPKEKKDNVTFVEIGLTGLYSEYSQMVRQYLGVFDTTYMGGCEGEDTINESRDRYSVPHRIKHSTYQTGLEVSYNIAKCKYTRVLIKGRGFYGRSKLKDMVSNNYYFETTWGFGPYIQFDWRPIGFGLGFQVGEFWNADVYKYNSDLKPGQYEYTPTKIGFYPQTHLRAGPYDIIYAEGRVYTLFPSGYLMPGFMAGLGTGFGRVDGSNLFAGYSNEGFLIEGVLPIKERYLVTGFVSNNFQSQPDEKFVCVLGFKYRFNFITKEKRKYLKKTIE